MFKSKKNQGEEALNIESLSGQLDASYSDVNDKLTTFFNALTLKDISEYAVLGQNLYKKSPKFAIRPSIDFCIQTEAFKDYAALLQGAKVEISMHSYSIGGKEICLNFSMQKEFFEKAQPVVLLDAPTTDALSADIAQGPVTKLPPEKKAAIT